MEQLNYLDFYTNLMNKMQHYITDTLPVMEHIRQLISTNTIILRNIPGYINRLLTIFGLRSSVPAVDDIGLTESTGEETSRKNGKDKFTHLDEKFGSFREFLHTEAIEIKNKEILTLCEHLRNQI